VKGDIDAFRRSVDGRNIVAIPANAALSGDDRSRTVHMAEVARALATLPAATRRNLLFAINDADVIDNDGMTPALAAVLAPVRLALLEALNAVPITPVQLDAIIDVARVISIQA
jgi:hypothetical protein